MSSIRLRVRSCLVALFFSAPSLLHGQVTVSADLAANSSYIWRGTTMTNRPVLQPDIVATFVRGGWTLLAAASANVEPSRYADPEHDISERGGTAAGIAEIDLWAELTRAAGTAQFTVGAQRYTFPNSAGLVAAQNTFEVYARASVATVLAPAVQLWVDTWRVRGAYAELSIAHDVRVGATSLHFAALEGYNVSETYSPETNQGYFGRAGFTHSDLSVSGAVPLGALTATPSVHVIVAADPRVRTVSPVSGRDSKVWAGISLGWSHRFER